MYGMGLDLNAGYDLGSYKWYVPVYFNHILFYGGRAYKKSYIFLNQ